MKNRETFYVLANLTNTLFLEKYEEDYEFTTDDPIKAKRFGSYSEAIEFTFGRKIYLCRHPQCILILMEFL